MYEIFRALHVKNEHKREKFYVEASMENINNGESINSLAGIKSKYFLMVDNVFEQPCHTIKKWTTLKSSPIHQGLYHLRSHSIILLTIPVSLV